MMAWDQKFEVGHERIDFEHRIFLGLVRDLSQTADATGADSRFERILREIFKYADFHFYSEENIMAEVGYPQLDGHRKLHEMLLAELTDRIHGFRDGRETPAAIVEFLFQWFALHTTREDKAIAEFIRNPR